MPNFLVQGPDGKPIFTGKEDPTTPPVSPKRESSKMECPVCKGQFDYLLGDDLNGGVMGCEKDWRPGKTQEAPSEQYDESKEII